MAVNTGTDKTNAPDNDEYDDPSTDPNISKSSNKSLDPDLEKLLSTESGKHQWNCMLRKGTVIGDYEIVSFVGNSAYGEAYIARHSLTRNCFMLKLLPPALSENAEFKKRFAMILDRAEERLHQNIVHIYKADCQHGIIDYYYIVYDYIECNPGDPASLKEMLAREEKIPEDEVRRTVIQLCSALEYAHNCESGHFIHSNLKPSNILFDKNGQVRVTDFDTIELIGDIYQRKLFKEFIQNSVDHDSRDENAASKTTYRQTNSTNILMAPFRDSPLLENTSSFEMLSSDNTISGKITAFLEKAVHKLGNKEISYKKKASQKKSSENLLLRRARATPNSMSRLAIDSILETYDYYSPEQKTGESPTQQSNVYTVGLIIYTMLTGRKMTVTWDPPSKYGVSKTWDHIVKNAVRSNPHDRYKTITAMKKDIQELRPGGEKIINMLVSIGIIGFMSIIGFFLLGPLFPGAEKESRKNPTGPRIITLSNDQLTKIRVNVKFSPENAKIKIFRNRFPVLETDNVPEAGIHFFADNSTYTIEAESHGYLPFKLDFTPDTQNKTFVFSMSKAAEKKTYSYLKGSSVPEKGFLWNLERLNILMIPLEPGKFKMGCPLSKNSFLADETAQKEVSLNYHFWISEKEITQGQYQEIMEKNPSFFKASELTLPVEKVTWSDAVEFCSRLMEREKARNTLPNGYVYRLPTEQEWEYAARAGTQNIYGNGDTTANLKQIAWGKDNSGGSTNHTGTLEPNPWQIYDMQGNVWEWCADVINFKKQDGTSGSKHIARGGAWNSPQEQIRPSARMLLEGKSTGGTSIGFRIVLAPPLEDTLNNGQK